MLFVMVLVFRLTVVLFFVIKIIKLSQPFSNLWRFSINRTDKVYFKQHIVSERGELTYA